MPINNTHLERLFSYFARPPGYQARGDDDELLQIQLKCKELFEKDYNISIIQNRNGELCATYPLDLIILESDKHKVPFTRDTPKKVNDAAILEPLLLKGRFARVRARFPVPVILWNNKNVCRSSTLSQKLEYVLQTAHNQVKNQLNGSTDSITLSHMENLRTMDIGVIKQLSVKYIVDLMMENKKKKFGFTVCSSEKVDMHDRYAPFAIASVPYPGVEFFQEFNQRKHIANDLHFDWDKPADYVQLKVDHINNNIAVQWAEYKTWDLVVLTQNYLKLMLHFISDGSPNSGLLVHCISGWDRTPLFISLLRISLWADGEIHQSLSAEEMLYLTVAYDWLLFSHQLSDRASRGEDIFYFCFYFLQFITSTEFSVKPQSSPQSPPPPQQPLFQSDTSPSQPPPRKLSNGHAKHPNPHSHPHSFNHSCPSYAHHHTLASRSMPTQLALYPPARDGGDSTAPIDVPGPRHHSPKVSYDSAASIENGQFGSWQMMEMSLNDKTSPINIGSFHDPTVLVVSPASKRTTIPTTNTLSDAADDSVSDTSSSRDFDHLSEPSTSWENEGVFWHEPDSSCRQAGGDKSTKHESEQNGSLVEPQDKAARRVQLLTQLGDAGIAYYKQCCVPQANNNWMPQGIWRLLPRFV